MARSLDRTVATLAVVVGALAVPAAAAPGDLDPTFSRDGFVTAFGSGSAAAAIDVAPDGRVVVVGYTLEDGSDAVIVRLRPDGSFDPSFSDDGRVRIHAAPDDQLFDVVVGASGGIVAAGRRNGPGKERMLVVRLRADGSPAPGFGGGDGIATITFDKPFQGAAAVGLASRGRIQLGGYVSGGTTSRSAFVRLRADGSPDPTFGGDGRISLDVSQGSEQVADLEVRPDDGVLAAGYADVGLAPRAAVIRLRPNGQPDDAFRRDGSAAIDLVPGPDLAFAIARTAGGIAVAGMADRDLAVARLGAGGRLDASFGEGGVWVLRSRDGFDHAAELLAVGKKLVAVGRIGNDLAVVRLRSSGERDPTFGRNGVARINPYGTADIGSGLARQANGKLVVAGSTSRAGVPRMLVARLRAG